MNTSPGRLKKILVVRNDRFGEFLLNIPALRALKDSFPGVRITLVIDPAVKELAARIPYVDELLFWKRGRHFFWAKLSFLGQLVGRGFDAAVILNPTRGMNIFVFLAGIPVRVGYERKWGFLLSHTMPDTKGEGKKHEVDANLEVVGLLGAKTADKSLLLDLRNNLPGRDLIAVHPFTSDPVKQWPLDRFRELVSRLKLARIGQVVVIGKKEPGQSDFVTEDQEVVNLVDKTNLIQLAFILSQSKVLISCDSGPVHLARCVQTPVIALFRNDMRGKNPERWGPWGTGNIVIQHRSLEQISVDEVEAAVRGLINDPQRPPAEIPESCDIIIPVYNQLDYTKQCLDSIIRTTAYPHKTIVVDDASGQETKAYLRTLAAAGRIELCENPQNMGWVASVNEGIKRSTAPYLCIMNNDIEAYPGWLYEMINVARSDEKIGIVNPTWEIPKYSRLARKDFYARVVARRSGEYIETDWARGFCFLVKRRVIEAIGGLDPAFSPGYYDDWDFSLRAAQAGFIIVRALGSFVWHYKNVSYKKKLGENNFNKILAEREVLFRKRWGNPARIFVISGPESSGEPARLEKLLLTLLRGQAKVTLVSTGKLAVNHTNCRVSGWPYFLLPLVAMIRIIDNVRLGPHKRFNLIIASAQPAGFFRKFSFVKNNFPVVDLETAFKQGVELINQDNAHR